MALTTYPLQNFAVCQDPNAGARRAAKYRNAATLYKWNNEKANYHNKETRYLKGGNIATIGHSRAISDATENAFRLAGQGRQQKAAIYKQWATGQRVDEGGGSRTAGRNQYLQLLDKHASIEYSIDEAWGLGMQKAQLGADRQLRNAWNKLDTALGIPKSPPMLEPVPPVDKMGQLMDGIQKGIKIASVAAAPFTGGASLGIGGIGKAGGQWNPFSKLGLQGKSNPSFDFSSLTSGATAFLPKGD